MTRLFWSLCCNARFTGRDPSAVLRPQRRSGPRTVLPLAIIAALEVCACKGSPSTPTTTTTVLLALSVSASSVPGGTSLTGTVTLSGAAPSEGAVVSLVSSDVSAIVPASVTVAAGEISQTFDIQTAPLPASTAVILTATYSSGSVTTTFTIGRLALQSLSLSANSVTSGGTVIGTVTLTGPAPPEGAQGLLASDSAPVRVPASVTIPPADTSQIFEIRTVDAATSASATITATLLYSGSTENRVLNSCAPGCEECQLRGTRPRAWGPSNYGISDDDRRGACGRHHRSLIEQQSRGNHSAPARDPRRRHKPGL